MGFLNPDVRTDFPRARERFFFFFLGGGCGNIEHSMSHVCFCCVVFGELSGAGFVSSCDVFGAIFC